MTTGDFQDWAGTISEIGAIYPFVGSEFLLWILGLAFWIGWHIWNLSTEHREWDEIRRLSAKTPPPEEHME